MKKTVLLLLFSIFSFGIASAQKAGYVDTKFIMDKLPEYSAAQKEIDRQSEIWQNELEEKYKKIEKMYKDYTAKEVLLTEDVKKQEQELIIKEEQAAKEFQKKKFGYEGELFQMRSEKVKPIQDKVFDAVEAVAKEKRVDFVFDKSGQAMLLYTNALFDLSDEVLVKLGIGK